MEEGKSSFNTSALGSAGWQSAEVLKNEKRTKAVDIFSMEVALQTSNDHVVGTVTKAVVNAVKRPLRHLSHSLIEHITLSVAIIT